MKRIAFLFFILLVFSANYLNAGVTGKITGKIVDAESGDPLPGANIIINGTLSKEINMELKRLGYEINVDEYFNTTISWD